MSGYAVCMAPCVRCRRVIAFNPHKVPSLLVDGVKQPLCRECFDWRQAQRHGLGLPNESPPLEGAYEGLPEEEL